MKFLRLLSLLLLYLNLCKSHKEKFPMMQRMRIRERINDRLMRHRQRSTICYDMVGCVELPHFNSPLQKIPEDPKILQTKFYLFRRNIEYSEPEIIFINDKWSSLNRSKFNYTQSLKVIVHGYLSNWNERGNLLAADAYTKLYDCNVLIMDWAIGAGRQYAKSAANTEIVGRLLGMTLAELIRRGLNYKNIHLIGFSLGAHVSGVASETLKRKNILIGRITGLDAAGPLFRRSHLREKSKKLDLEDAEFVDVLHTDSSPSFVDGFGLWEPIGHVDFFANGGKQQPGCTDSKASVIVTQLEKEYTLDMFCSHIRAMHIYLEALYNKLSQNKCEFIAYKCRTGVQSFEDGQCFPEIDRYDNSTLSINKYYRSDIGRFAEKSIGNGVMYFTTRDSKPFCGTQLRASVRVLHISHPVKGALQLQLSYNKNYTAKFQIMCDFLNGFKGETMVYGITAIDGLDENLEIIKASLSYMNHQNGLVMENNDRSSPRHVEIALLMSNISVMDIYGNRWNFCDNLFLKDKNETHFEIVNFELVKRKC